MGFSGYLDREEVLTVGELIEELKKYNPSDIVMVCGNVEGYEYDRLAVFKVMTVPYAPHEVILDAWDYNVPTYEEHEKEDDSWGSDGLIKGLVKV